jgi:hypothetical protein
MKWIPLLVTSGRTGISAQLVITFTTIIILSNKQTTNSLVMTGLRVNQNYFLKIFASTLSTGI